MWPGKGGVCRKVGATANLDSSCARRLCNTAGRGEETGLQVEQRNRSRKKDAPLRNRLTKKAPYKGGLHRSAWLRCRQADQGQEAAYSGRYTRSAAARHRPCRRRSGPRWRPAVARHAVWQVSIPREAVCRQRLSRSDFCRRARRNPALSQNRNHQTIRPRIRFRAATQALDRRAYDCLAQPLPPSRQGLGKSQLQRSCLLETRLHPPHAKKALQSLMKF